MNLLVDPFVDVSLRGGGQIRISAVQIADTRMTDIQACRPDFRGALYQFLIAALQLSFAPPDQEAWRALWKQPPSDADLRDAFTPFLAAFELDSKGPAFMQDFALPDAEPKGIASLLIESPGDKTILDNLDHFVHRAAAKAMCPVCAASALFTLQINAPSGGAGHRVSVRGGGPLTSLLIPNDPDASLWHKLWLNVLPQDALDYPEIEKLADVLPWLAPTRVSDPKGVGDTTPETVHPLQAYWSMPRRIRLDFSEQESGHCSLCGTQSDQLIRHYRTRNYGVNYTGAWLHPLTPYSHDPKTGLLSIKGQPGGIGFHHWLGLTLGNADNKPAAAQVVAHHNAKRYKLPARLWCFGMDMDNMKARCWYDSTLPLYEVLPDRQVAFAKAVRLILDVAVESAGLLSKQVKSARFSRPADVKSDPAVSASFWQQSETEFYTVLGLVADADVNDDEALARIYGRWLRATRRIALTLFDDWVQTAPIEDMNMRRVVAARAEMLKWLSVGKVMKPLWKIVDTYSKETA